MIKIILPIFRVGLYCFVKNMVIFIIVIFHFKGNKGMAIVRGLAHDAKSYRPRMPICEHIGKRMVLGLFQTSYTKIFETKRIDFNSRKKEKKKRSTD